MQIEDATAADAEACAAVYAPYVRDTVITFELDPPTAQDMARRIATAQRAHAWLVARDGDRVVGYAYGGAYHARPAYRWTCEVSIYLEPGRRRSGLGRSLYTELFARLEARGYRTLVAGMTLPNPASEGLHAALGFERIGVSRSIGWKHDAWRDVAWCQRPIGRWDDDPPAEPR